MSTYSSPLSASFDTGLWMIPPGPLAPLAVPLPPSPPPMKAPPPQQARRPFLTPPSASPPGGASPTTPRRPSIVHPASLRPASPPQRAGTTRRPSAPRPQYPARSPSRSRPAARTLVPASPPPESPPALSPAPLPLMVRIPQQTLNLQQQQQTQRWPRARSDGHRSDGSTRSVRPTLVESPVPFSPSSDSPDSAVSATPTLNMWSRPESAASYADSTPPSPPPSAAEEDEKYEIDQEYYFVDDMATFLVERRLFKVHRYFFERESKTFRETYLESNGTLVEKLTKLSNGPISLPNVSVEEFRSLLNYFYHGLYDEAVSTTSWMLLLSISTKLDFPRIRQRAVAALSDPGQLDPIEQIVLAARFDLPQWLPRAYEAVCTRAEPLELSEAELVGLRTAVLLAKARERVLRELGGLKAARMPPDCEEDRKRREEEDRGVVESVVRDVFWPEGQMV